MGFRAGGHRLAQRQGDLRRLVFSVPAAAVQALRSGADMVLFDLGSNVSPQTSSIATAITNAVTGGHLSRSRLIDAAGHVLAVRHVNLCS